MSLHFPAGYRKGTAGNTGTADSVSEAITQGLGGKKNISDVDCCATRLRITVHDAARVNDEIIKTTGSRGIVKKGQGVQIIYGPQVTVIKSKLEDYLETAPSPIIFPANPSSGQVVISPAIPVIGLDTTIVFTTFSWVSLFSFTVSVFSSAEFSSDTAALS